MSFPEDIFTEQEADPDTLANLGPLRRLAGVWESQAAGVDVNPKAEGPERRDFSERIELQPIDAQSNGPQLLYGLRYHTRILAADEDATFHDQTGYWLWEPARPASSCRRSRSRAARWRSPRGTPAADATELVLTARRGETELRHLLEQPSSSTPSAPTRIASRWCSTRRQLELCAGHDAVVRGRAEPFLHRDRNTLFKVEEPTPNPLQLLAKSRGEPPPAR